MTLRAHVQTPLYYYLSCDAIISGPVCTATSQGPDINSASNDADREFVFTAPAERGWSVHSSPHSEKGPDYCPMHTADMLHTTPGWHGRPEPTPTIDTSKTYIPPVT